MVMVVLKAMMGDSMKSLKLVDLKMNLVNPQSPMVVVMIVMMVLVVIELVVVMLLVLMVVAFGDKGWIINKIYSISEGCKEHRGTV